MAACLEHGLGGRSLTDPQVRQIVEVGRVRPRQAKVVDAAAGDPSTVDVHADVEAAAVVAAAAGRRRAEPDGDRVPAVVGQPAAVVVARRRGRSRRSPEDFDVRKTMSATVEDAQSQFVAPSTDLHLQRPANT